MAAAAGNTWQPNFRGISRFGAGEQPPHAAKPRRVHSGTIAWRLCVLLKQSAGLEMLDAQGRVHFALRCECIVARALAKAVPKRRHLLPEPSSDV